MTLSVNDLSNYTISVVIPAYNAERWIGEALDSVLAQTYPPTEVIVVDDGSTDGTRSVIQRYAGRVNYLYQENRGQAAARNAGIRAAIGEYIAFIDADDLWQAEKLALQVEKLKEGYEWVICNFANFDDSTHQLVDMPKLKLYEGDVLEQLFLICFIGSPTPVVKRDIFDKVGGFDESPSLLFGEDWEMWLRIAASYPLGVVHKTLALHRLHPTSAMAITDPMQKMENKKKIIEEIVARYPARLGKLKFRALSHWSYGLGVTLFKQEQYFEAKAQFLKVLEHRPFHGGALTYLTMIALGPGFSKPIVRWKRRLFAWLKRLET